MSHQCECDVCRTLRDGHYPWTETGYRLLGNPGVVENFKRTTPGEIVAMPAEEPTPLVKQLEVAVLSMQAGDVLIVKYEPGELNDMPRWLPKVLPAGCKVVFVRKGTEFEVLRPEPNRLSPADRRAAIDASIKARRVNPTWPSNPLTEPVPVIPLPADEPVGFV